jgi:pyrimidine-nucleoside phosphorylase
MHEPLGYAIGNWVEIEECISIMNPDSEKSSLSDGLIEVTLTLAGAMLMLAGKCSDIFEGIKMAEEKLYNGECFNKFIEMVETQGGDSEYILYTDKYKKANVVNDIKAHSSGYISRLDGLNFGKAAVNLGCGRKKVSDKIDYSAGIILKKKSGDKIEEGETVCLVMGEDKSKIESACRIAGQAVEINNELIEPKSKILEIID